MGVRKGRSEEMSKKLNEKVTRPGIYLNSNTSENIEICVNFR